MPVEDKLAIHETNYISLHNTHTCHSAQQTKQHASNIRAAYYFYLAGKNYWWSNTNYHWLWWVQRMQTKKTLPRLFVTFWITLRKISL